MCYTEGEVQQSLKTSGVKRPMGEGDPHKSDQVAQDFFLYVPEAILMSCPCLFSSLLLYRKKGKDKEVF